MEFKEEIWPIRNRLYRLALRLVNDRAEAEDVVQEVMIKLWRQGQQLSVIKNIEAWSIKLTRNLALDKLKGGYCKRRTALDDQQHQTTPHSQRPDGLLERKEVYLRIKRLIQELPENHRLVVHLRDIEELSYQEIAEALNMSISQVKTNLFRGRKKLRELLQNQSSYGL